MTMPDAPPPGGGDDQSRGLSGAARAGIALGALAVLLIAFVVLRGGDSEPSGSAGETTTTQAATATTTAAGPAATTDGAGTTDDAPSETGSTPTETRPEAPRVPTINVVDGQPRGGVRRLEFERGERIRFKVRSNTADEIHVHGFDVTRDLTPGRTVQLSFPANIEGRFEVELHGTGTQIALLVVTPS